MNAPAWAPRARSLLFKALRAAFRAIPMPDEARDGLRERFLRTFPAVRPLPGAPTATDGREPGMRVRADERCIGYVEYSEQAVPESRSTPLVAFYLPQFHVIPENDAWWGRGFTEWRNVARALPQFEGHVQPRLPGDLGFYDLRNPQVMRDQAKLARTYGLSAFCFYFYWFDGRTLLEEPLRQWLADTSIDFEYCLCWANENWTRRWDGRDEDVLIAQRHGAGDDLAFIEHVAEYLRDPRYLRLDGKPVLLLYRPSLLPDVRATAERWRTWCRANGIGEIHLAYVESFERPPPASIGFDAAVEFPPNLVRQRQAGNGRTGLRRGYAGEILDWRDVADACRARVPSYPLHRGVNCGWDNEPRRPGAGRTFVHATPSRYRDWLSAMIASADRQPGGTHAVFINAWNEWAEGAVLEPDAAHGYAWLSATRAAVQHARRPAAGVPALGRPCVVIHGWFPDVLDGMLRRIRDWPVEPRLVVTTSHDRVDGIRKIVLSHFPRADVVPFDNRGRDILPFLQVATRLRDEGEDVVLKLHTKRSPHIEHGHVWLAELLDALASREAVERIVDAFHRDERLGLVAPEGHLLRVDDYPGGNRRWLSILAQRVGIGDAALAAARFAAGSMFWTRLSALAPLLEADIFSSDFETESGQIDGTFAHAVERIFAAVVEESGCRVMTTSALSGTPARSGRYPFAR